MFRRFRITSPTFSKFVVSGTCCWCRWRFASSSTPTINNNKYEGMCVKEILCLPALEVAEFQSSSSSSSTLDPKIFENMTVEDFIESQNSHSSCKFLFQNKLMSVLIQSISKNSCARLVPGNVHRHTRVLPYGMLARDNSLQMIDSYFEKLKSTRYSGMEPKKEDLPLALLASIPRQGKTLFLDTVANDIRRSWCFLTLNSEKKEFVAVFNITFNSEWSISKDARFNIRQASNQIAMRLLAAAKGIFKYDTHFVEGIGIILEFCQPSLPEVIALLQNRLQQLFDDCNPNLIILIDEMTELAERVFAANGSKSSARAELYSAITSIVSSSCAVVVSGFTFEGSDYFSLSGHPIVNCSLPPLCNAELRRSASPMITLYFQSIHSRFSPPNHDNNNNNNNNNVTDDNSDDEIVSHAFKSALFFFELMKSSLGIFGAVSENIGPFVSNETRSLHALLNSIPKLQGHVASFPLSAMAVLQWKSIQFCPFERNEFSTKNTSGLVNSVPKKFLLDMVDDCDLAGKKRNVFVGTGKISWAPVTSMRSSVETGKVLIHSTTPKTKMTDEQQEIEERYRKWSFDHDLDSRVPTPLSSIGIEPMFLFMNAAVGVARWFNCFRTMLLNYSLAFYILGFSPPPQFKKNINNNNNNNNKFRHVESDQFQREFSCFGLSTKNKSFENDCAQFVQQMITLRFQVKSFILDDEGKTKTWLSGTPLDVKEYLRQTRQIINSSSATTAVAKDVAVYLDCATRRHDTTLHDYFFEDAVAIGICAQKNLRFAASRGMPSFQDAVDCSVNRFLSGSAIHEGDLHFFYDSATRIFAQLEKHDIVIRWIDRNLTFDEQQAPVQFVGHFPSHHHNMNNEAPQILVIDETTGSVSNSPLRAKQHFNRETVLVPARPENNPLVDVIFHENLAGEDEEKGLVQFWVDAKHRHARYSSDKKSPDHFAKTVATALQNPLLKSSAVKHVVHVIVATNATNDEEAKIRSTQMKNALRQQFINDSPTSSPSYSLYFIHPDSFAFENLVSQPIARAMPLTDQQLTESWRQRLAVFPEWRNYKATTSDGLDRMIHSAKEFCEWRQLRLKDDGISTLESCLPTNSNDFDFIENFSNLPLPIQYRIKTMSFGVLLENFGVLHNQQNKDARLTYSGNIFSASFGLKRKKGSSGSTSTKKVVIITTSSNDEVEVDPASFKIFMRRNVLLGHLIDGHFDQYDNAMNIWNFLYEETFKSSLLCLVQEFALQQQQYFQEKDYSNAAVLGKILWNTPVNQWTKNWSAFRNRKSSEKIDVLKPFDVNCFDKCFSKKNDTEIFQSEKLCFCLWVLYSRKSHEGLTRFSQHSRKVTSDFEVKLSKALSLEITK